MDINNKLFITAETINDIANAIRAKEESTEPIPGNEFASRILALSGSDEITNSETIEMVAQDQIKIGDTVYAIKNGANNLKEPPHCTPIDYTVNNAVFSPDGKLIVLGFGGYHDSNYVKVYSVDNDSFTYISDLQTPPYRPKSGFYYVDQLIFSPDSKTLIVVDDYYSSDYYHINAYSVNETSTAFVSEIYMDNENTSWTSSLENLIFSPDGKTLLIIDNTNYVLRVYSVNGQNFTYSHNIYVDNNNTPFDDKISLATFSPDGKTLIVAGYFVNRVNIYSVDNQVFTYVGNMYADNDSTPFDSKYFNSALFSPDGNTFILTGYFTGKGKIYSVKDQVFTYVDNIYLENGESLDFESDVSAFSPDGKILLLTSTNVYKFLVDGQNITYDGLVYSDGGDGINGLAFSPDGKVLVVAGWMYDDLDSDAKVYSVNNQTITYLHEFYWDSIPTTDLTVLVNAAVFSPNGDLLIVGNDNAKIYSVNGQELTYIGNIYADNNGNILNADISTIAFSKNGDLVLIGGGFGVKLYSINNQTITYISDIYDNNGKTLSSVKAAAIAPNNTLIICGSRYVNFYLFNGEEINYLYNIPFTTSQMSIEGTALLEDGKTVILGIYNYSSSSFYSVQIYSIEEEGVRFIENIYANNGTMPFSSINYISISQDGKFMIIVTDDNPKFYSINNQKITYIGDIYADNKNSNFDPYAVYTAAFSSNNKFIIIGGRKFAKIYSFDNETVKFISNIYLDNIGTEFDGTVYVASFAPDDKTFVLGGSFTLCGMSYPLSEQGQINYQIPGIYLAENGNIQNLSAGCYLGFATSEANCDELVSMRTIGKYVANDEIAIVLEGSY